MVARIMLIGLFEPSDFVKISPTPANSNTARTGPPEITPVPSAAGFISTLPDPNCPFISWGIVVPTIGTLIKFFFASSIAFLIASGTSSAFPWPNPTCPFLSPTTTIAAKRKRRPPLTTFATRFTVTTRSSKSILLVSMFTLLFNVTIPSFFIKIPSRLLSLHQRVLLHVHDKYSRHGQILLLYILFQSRALLQAFPLVPLLRHCLENQDSNLFHLCLH